MGSELVLPPPESPVTTMVEYDEEPVKHSGVLADVRRILAMPEGAQREQAFRELIGSLDFISKRTIRCFAGSCSVKEVGILSQRKGFDKRMMLGYLLKTNEGDSRIEVLLPGFDATDGELFHEAIASENLIAIKYFLNNGAKVTAGSLEVAIGTGSVDIVRLLTRSGGDLYEDPRAMVRALLTSESEELLYEILANDKLLLDLAFQRYRREVCGCN